MSLFSCEKRVFHAIRVGSFTGERYLFDRKEDRDALFDGFEKYSPRAHIAVGLDKITIDMNPEFVMMGAEWPTVKAADVPRISAKIADRLEAADVFLNNPYVFSTSYCGVESMPMVFSSHADASDAARYVKSAVPGSESMIRMAWLKDLFPGCMMTEEARLVALGHVVQMFLKMERDASKQE